MTVTISPDTDYCKKKERMLRARELFLLDVSRAAHRLLAVNLTSIRYQLGAKDLLGYDAAQADVHVHKNERANGELSFGTIRTTFSQVAAEDLEVAAKLLQIIADGIKGEIHRLK